MRSTPARSGWYMALLLLLLLLCVLPLIAVPEALRLLTLPAWSGNAPKHSVHTLPMQHHHVPSDLAHTAAANSTLGFQHVFAINLPSRPDRRDKLALMAALSHIDVTHVEGVQMPSAGLSFALPRHSGKMPRGKQGCFRAHANVWRTIVEQRITTALVLEDDVDWDVRVKAAMQRLQAPLLALQHALALHTADGQPSSTAPAWDIVRLGTCLDPAHTEESHRANVSLENPPFVVYTDETATGRKHTSYEHAVTLDSYQVPLEERGGYRIVQQSNYPVCLHAYGLTQRGAAKLLYLTSKGFIDDANDLTVARLTQRGLLNSYTVLPSLFGQWKVEGWRGNSDIKREATSRWSAWWARARHGADEGLGGHAWDIERSIRREMGSMLGF